MKKLAIFMLLALLFPNFAKAAVVSSQGPVASIGAFTASTTKLARGQNVHISVPVKFNTALPYGNTGLQIFDSTGELIKKAVVNFGKVTNGSIVNVETDFVPGNDNILGNYGVGIYYVWAPDLTASQQVPYVGKLPMFEVVASAPVQGPAASIGAFTASTTKLARGQSVHISVPVKFNTALPSGNTGLQIFDSTGKAVKKTVINFGKVTNGSIVNVETDFVPGSDNILGNYGVGIYYVWAPDLTASQQVPYAGKLPMFEVVASATPTPAPANDAAITVSDITVDKPTIAHNDKLTYTSGITSNKDLAGAGSMDLQILSAANQVVTQKTIPLSNLKANVMVAANNTFMIPNDLPAGSYSMTLTGTVAGIKFWKTKANAFAVVSPVDGACGSAQGVSSATAPSANLCKVGTASVVTANAANFNWSCAGSNSGIALSCSAPRKTTAVLLGDGVNYPVGSYNAYNGPWGKGSLVAGKDFADKMIIDPGSFPNNTQLTWAWPNATAPYGVYGFLQLSYGGAPIIKDKIPSKQVKAINSLFETINITFAGELTNYDVITDIFLTNKPGNNYDEGNELFEIGIFHHTPPATMAWLKYDPNKVTIGTFKDPQGRTWNVTRVGKYIQFIPIDQADVGVGIVDVKSMMNYLIGKNVLNGNEYFNGLGLGSEPLRGTGSMQVNQFAVTYN